MGTSCPWKYNETRGSNIETRLLVGNSFVPPPRLQVTLQSRRGAHHLVHLGLLHLRPPCCTMEHTVVVFGVPAIVRKKVATGAGSVLQVIRKTSQRTSTCCTAAGLTVGYDTKTKTWRYSQRVSKGGLRMTGELHRHGRNHGGTHTRRVTIYHTRTDRVRGGVRVSGMIPPNRYMEARDGTCAWGALSSRPERERRERRTWRRERWHDVCTNLVKPDVTRSPRKPSGSAVNSLQYSGSPKDFSSGRFTPSCQHGDIGID